MNHAKVPVASSCPPRAVSARSVTFTPPHLTSPAFTIRLPRRRGAEPAAPGSQDRGHRPCRVLPLIRRHRCAGGGGGHTCPRVAPAPRRGVPTVRHRPPAGSPPRRSSPSRPQDPVPALTSAPLPGTPGQADSPLLPRQGRPRSWRPDGLRPAVAAEARAEGQAGMDGPAARPSRSRQESPIRISGQGPPAGSHRQRSTAEPGFRSSAFLPGRLSFCTGPAEPAPQSARRSGRTDATARHTLTPKAFRYKRMAAADPDVENDRQAVIDGRGPRR